MKRMRITRDMLESIINEEWDTSDEPLDYNEPGDVFIDHVNHVATFGTIFAGYGEDGPEVNIERSVMDVARSRIASAAPDFGRVLLEIEWAGPEDTCPVCGGNRPESASLVVMGHKRDCDWFRAMKKAGLR